MIVRIRRRVWVGCLVLLGVGVMARLSVEAAARWEQWRIEREQLQAKLSALRGWVAVAPMVASQVATVFGSEPVGSTAILEGLSRQARATGVRVTELKPLVGEIELGVEGSAASLGLYLHEIAAHRPPLRVESLNMVSQPKESAPIAMRIRVRTIGVSGGARG